MMEEKSYVSIPTETADFRNQIPISIPMNKRNYHKLFEIDLDAELSELPDGLLADGSYAADVKVEMN